MDAAEFSQHRAAGRFHPWSPAFVWWLTNKTTRTIRSAKHAIDAYPAAFDVLMLRQLPEIREDAALLRRALQRIRDEREAALWELRTAGYYRAIGMGGAWTAI